MNWPKPEEKMTYGRRLEQLQHGIGRLRDENSDISEELTEEAFYRRLAAARPVLQKYLKGWLNRTADLRRFVVRPA